MNNIGIEKGSKDKLGYCNACDYDSHIYFSVKQITLSGMYFRLCYKCAKELKKKL